MGELGHVNTVIRVRELGVDCFIDEHREPGIKVAELYSLPLLFAVFRRKTFNLSQSMLLERKPAFLF